MFSLKVLGGACIHAVDHPFEVLAIQRRRVGLLALLAVPSQTGTTQRRPGMSRERLIAHLWPDASTERGRHMLSDSVYRINQALGGDAILSTGDALRLNELLLSSDIAQMEQAVALRDHAGVVALYAGPFLDGMFLADSTEFERWTDWTRMRFARQYASSAEALANDAEHRGDALGAVDWWRMLSAHDPHDSRIAVRLMEALAVSGARAAALRHAESHTALLRSEFGIEADASVHRMVASLRSEAPANHAVRIAGSSGSNSLAMNPSFAMRRASSRPASPCA